MGFIKYRERELQLPPTSIRWLSRDVTNKGETQEACLASDSSGVIAATKDKNDMCHGHAGLKGLRLGGVWTMAERVTVTD
ncbi:hypothetical protein JTE90_010675 [Oedothorax gibbosus]|uniref:Uncharacterized protein n=1 Tax=Oedothorax gibbosus TaxID=931172 RepID=A0AAV6UU53_9ARAC|nr:hypothetical protein JTE90_010675 [Oedothorax gibbosus]